MPNLTISSIVAIALVAYLKYCFPLEFVLQGYQDVNSLNIVLKSGWRAGFFELYQLSMCFYYVFIEYLLNDKRHQSIFIPLQTTTEDILCNNTAYNKAFWLLALILKIQIHMCIDRFDVEDLYILPYSSFLDTLNIYIHVPKGIYISTITAFIRDMHYICVSVADENTSPAFL